MTAATATELDDADLAAVTAGKNRFPTESANRAIDALRKDAKRVADSAVAAMNGVGRAANTANTRFDEVGQKASRILDRF